MVLKGMREKQEGASRKTSEKKAGRLRCSGGADGGGGGACSVCMT